MCTACDEARPAPAFFRFFAEGCAFCAARRIQYIQRTLKLPPTDTRDRCRKALAQALELGLDEKEIRATAKASAWALAPTKEGAKP